MANPSDMSTVKTFTTKAGVEGKVYNGKSGGGAPYNNKIILLPFPDGKNLLRVEVIYRDQTLDATLDSTLERVAGSVKFL
jgi:hypothetical protein